MPVGEGFDVDDGLFAHLDTALDGGRAHVGQQTIGQHLRASGNQQHLGGRTIGCYHKYLLALLRPKFRFKAVNVSWSGV